MNLRLKEVYKLFGKKIGVKDQKVLSITADSRNIKKGQIFFALVADRDGHDYVADTIKAGAVAVVVQKKVQGVDDKKQIIVKDTKDALLELGKYYLKKFKKLKIVAVTGSNGKTTTKELLSCLLSAGYKVHKNEKSFNNYLGLPMTIFDLKNEHKILVLEIGMNHSGEIKKLISDIKLDVAIITNVGRAHIGNFSEKEKGIAKAKAEIMDSIKKGGIIILNREDKFYEFLKKKAISKKIKVLSFGTGEKANTRIEKYILTDNGSEFKVSTVKENLKMNLKGIHNVYNAASAITVAKFFNISDLKIKKVLSKFEMEGFMRFEEIKLKNGITIINDCYNANPDSFSASIETLKKLGYKNLIVLMGEMLEMGSLAANLHIEVGAMFSGLDIKKFFIYGENACNVEKGYENAVSIHTDREKLKEELKSFVQSGDTVFVKGSRGNKLEEIISCLS